MRFGTVIKNRVFLLICLLALAATAGCSNNKPLKVGVENNFRPFTYTEGGEIKGFEVELWQAIAEKANIEYELVPMEAVELNEAVTSGEVDLAIAGLTVNKARKDNFAFSEPYFETGLVILTTADNTDIQDKKGLAGKVVATQTGSSAYTYAGGIEGLKEVRGYADISEAYNQLKNKKVDAVIFDERSVHHFMQTTGDGKVKMVGEVLNKESYGVMATKESRYIGRINQAITAVGNDGTYESLYAKWMGGQPKKLPGQ
ncbi:substrate-binding periplasmic protein [Paenibacillus xerothermodurans]|uniref:Glutamine ABC transporter substrate-bindnig protein n=1 Tax=Paenibacillus xerothermodurans TaxID=1977292 RepID=A0A2W1N4K6_PAEXE|nr:transporter substrate-binding domain-containing protein [Paenibacillus xerothermodurans]PZE19669.1 glutamine ABC transporter substrate-bindnig protein [Paenibacillus xerothermodurans]